VESGDEITYVSRTGAALWPSDWGREVERLFSVHRPSMGKYLGRIRAAS